MTPWYDAFLPIAERSDLPESMIWSSVNPMYANSGAGIKAVANKNGQHFALYLMPDLLQFADSADGFKLYASICAKAGLKMVISGTSYYSQYYCNVYDCMPLPYSDTPGGQDWGSTSDVADKMHTLLGWDNFVIHESTTRDNLQAYPSSFSSPKRAVCGSAL